MSKVKKSTKASKAASQTDVKLDQADVKVDRAATQADVKVDHAATQADVKVDQAASQLDVKVDQAATQADLKVGQVGYVDEYGIIQHSLLSGATDFAPVTDVKTKVKSSASRQNVGKRNGTTANRSGRVAIDELAIVDEVETDDLIQIGNSLVEQKGLNHHHLASADEFYTKGINYIITKGFKIEADIKQERTKLPEDREINKIVCRVIPTNVTLYKPIAVGDNVNDSSPLYPRQALLREKTYSGSLIVSCEVIATAHLQDAKGNLTGLTKERKVNISDVKLCRVPIIVKSCMCNTYGKSKEALIAAGESPSDPGGYFVVAGSEWLVNGTERMIFNQPKIYLNAEHGTSRTRCEFISKPGDSYQNSEQIIIVLHKNDSITIEVRRDKLGGTPLPFYILFRALGWSDDKTMIEHIVEDFDDDSNKEILELICRSLNAKYTDNTHRYTYDTIEAIKSIISMLPAAAVSKFDLTNHPDNYPKAIENILYLLDMYLLPHIGMSAEYRIDKLKFLAMLIRRTILVATKKITQTDRDSFRNKRVFTAGENYAATFKKFFNKTIVSQLKKKMKKDFKENPFSAVRLDEMVRQGLKGDQFEKYITKTIISGNRANIKLSKQSTTINRLNAQQLHRKNELNVISSLRQVSTTSADSARHSERAAEMRRIHMSQIGFICVAHSPPEGEKVGINKQMAIFATIAPVSSSEVLKRKVHDDPDIMSCDLTMKQIAVYNLGRVYVNGSFVGYTEDTFQIATKYRAMRRRLEINPYISVFWNNELNETHLFTDNGRLIRPLIIVYNNVRDIDIFGGKKPKDISSGFKQGIAVTADDIQAIIEGTKTYETLLLEQKIEFISPEEQENCLVAASYDDVRQHATNYLLEFTHCDIPQSQFGITALTAPMANHNQAPRVTYQTTQAKQTCGFYDLRWEGRMDKEAFLQYANEMPLVRTISNNYLQPNGLNCMVAICIYSGYNQEDSLIFNKASVERGMFLGSKVTFYKAELDGKDRLDNPDATNTINIKSANYEKLVNGKVPPKIIVEKGDVLIGKFTSISKGKDNKAQYTDTSIVYNQKEPAIIHDVVMDNDDDDQQFCKISMRKVRPVEVGDKFSSRSGQKGICGLLMRESDMPFNEAGVRPDIIFNPHGIPSRMTTAQLIECLMSSVCAVKGTQADATVFKKIDIEAIADQMQSIGYNRYGYQKLYAGVTGECIDVEIFMGPTYYQRLQKFVKDQEYSVTQASSDAITYQPIDGKSSNGGIRIGEMEKDVLVSHGVCEVLNEKFTKHSDGYIEYFCRCGKPAIVNVQENIYTCTDCKYAADIVAVQTSWAAKLLRQEMQSSNSGLLCIPKPYTFQTNDTADRQLSTVHLAPYKIVDIVRQDAEDVVDDSEA